MKRRPITTAFCIALMILAASLCVQAQEEQAGYVSNISGQWNLTLGGQTQSVRNAQRILVGSVIRPQSGQDDGSFITVVLRDGRQLFCTIKELDGCRQPVFLRNSSSFVSRLVDVVIGVFIPDPNRFRTGLSRGDEKGLQEAVVLLEKGQLDLSAVFKNMERDSYLLRFEPVSGNSELKEADIIDLVKFDWTPARPSLEIGNLKPGLYKLSLLERNTGEHEPTGENAWILVSNPKNYRPRSLKFQDAMRLTRDWPDSETTRRFLRAYLESLIVQPARPKK